MGCEVLLMEDSAKHRAARNAADPARLAGVLAIFGQHRVKFAPDFPERISERGKNEINPILQRCCDEHGAFRRRAQPEKAARP